MKATSRSKSLLSVVFLLGLLFVAACDKTAPTSMTPPANEPADMKQQRADKEGK